MGNFNRRNKDAKLITTKALPAAAASNNLDDQSWDINSAGVNSPEGVEIEISIPAIAAHTDTTKNVVITLTNSADNVTFTTLVPAVVVTFPGVASSGSVATLIRLKLPSTCLRYVSFTQAVDSGGPTLTASSITYSMCF